MKSAKNHSYIAGALLLALVWFAPASAVEFKRLVVFGTSLSDPGNFYALTGDALSAPYTEVDDLYIPPAPYSKGGNHFTNGATWIEQLAKTLRVGESAEAAIGTDSDAAANYSVGGARAREDGVNFNLPVQVATFFNDVGYVAPADALYVIDMGANDVRDALATGDPAQINAIFTAAINSIGTHLYQLYGTGARRFLVVNVPDLGVLPSIQIVNYFQPGAAAYATLLSGIFNDGLTYLLDGLQMLPGIQIARLDIRAKVAQVIANPAAYGLTDATSPCITPDIAPYNCKKPDSYLFWDGIHPTKAGHEILAHEALQILAQ